MIEAEQRQHDAMQVVDVNLVFDRSELKFIRGTNRLAPPDATSRDPDAKTVGAVVTPLVSLRHGCATALTTLIVAVLAAQAELTPRLPKSACAASQRQDQRGQARSKSRVRRAQGLPAE